LSHRIDLSALEWFPYYEIRTMKIPGRGREYVVAVQPRKGGRCFRISGPVLKDVIREAVGQAAGQDAVNGT
jgi:hypothetical protein